MWLVPGSRMLPREAGQKLRGNRFMRTRVLTDDEAFDQMKRAIAQVLLHESKEVLGGQGHRRASA